MMRQSQRYRKCPKCGSNRSKTVYFDAFRTVRQCLECGHRYKIEHLK